MLTIWGTTPEWIYEFGWQFAEILGFWTTLGWRTYGSKFQKSWNLNMDGCLQKHIRTSENAKLVGPVHCYPSLTHSLTNTMDWKSFWGNCRNNPPTKWVAMQIRPRTTRCLPCCFLRHPIFGGDSGASYQLKARGFSQPCIRQKWRVGRRGSPPQGVDRAIGREEIHMFEAIPSGK